MFYTLEMLQLYNQYLVIKMQPNEEKKIKHSIRMCIQVRVSLGHMIEINIWKEEIMKQVVTFGMFTVLMLSNLFWRYKKR